MAHLTSVRSKTLPDKNLFWHINVSPIGVLGEIVPFVFLIVFRFYARPTALQDFYYKFANQTFWVRRAEIWLLAHLLSNLRLLSGRNEKLKDLVVVEYYLFQIFFSIKIKNNITRIMRKFDFGSLVFHPSGLLGEIVPFVFLVVFRFYVRAAALRGFN